MLELPAIDQTTVASDFLKGTTPFLQKISLDFVLWIELKLI